MPDSENYHIHQIEVDGFELGENVFNFKNRFILGQSKHNAPNFSTSTILLEKSMPQGHDGQPIADFFSEQEQVSGEAQIILQIFLSCYHLTNCGTMPIPGTFSKMMATLSNPEEINMWARSGIVAGMIGGKPMKSKFQARPKEEVIDELEKTKPLFEQVMGIIGKSSKRKLDSLSIALIFYQRALTESDIIQRLLHFVTVIEALICDMGEQRYKFALRTASLLEENFLKI